MANVRVPLEDIVSSNLSAYGYDGHRRIAAVRFKDGRIIHYAGIDDTTWSRWRAAESKGKFYHHEIRGRYEGALMTGDCPRCGARGWLGDTCTDCGCAKFAGAVKHQLVWDDPSAVSKRSRKAECGGYFRPSEFATNGDAVTCSDCQVVIKEREAMEV